MIFIALAVVAAGADFVATRASGFHLRDVGEVWYLLDKNSLQLAQPAIERHISTQIWDPYIVTVLNWPLALVLLGLGAVLILLSRLIFGPRTERIYPD